MIAYRVEGTGGCWFVCLAKTAIHARREGVCEWGRGMTRSVEVADSSDCFEYQRVMGHIIISGDI